MKKKYLFITVSALSLVSTAGALLPGALSSTAVVSGPASEKFELASEHLLINSNVSVGSPQEGSPSNSNEIQLSSPRSGTVLASSAKYIKISGANPGGEWAGGRYGKKISLLEANGSEIIPIAVTTVWASPTGLSEAIDFKNPVDIMKKQFSVGNTKWYAILELPAGFTIADALEWRASYEVEKGVGYYDYSTQINQISILDASKTPLLEAYPESRYTKKVEKAFSPNDHLYKLFAAGYRVETSQPLGNGYVQVTDSERKMLTLFNSLPDDHPTKKGDKR